MLTNLSMVLFTYERQHMLENIINYHAPLGMDLFILDASKDAYVADALMKKYKNVHYYHLPNTSLGKRCNFVLDKIKTPYFVFRADRRHHSNVYYKEAITFLDKNPDYISASGVWFSYTYYKTCIELLRNSPQLAYSEFKSAIKKVLNRIYGYDKWKVHEHKLKKCYSLGLFDTSSEIDNRLLRVKYGATQSTPRFYNVMRSDFAKKLLPVFFNLDEDIKNVYYQEFIADFLFLVSGKTKKLPCLAGIVHSNVKKKINYINDKQLAYAMYFNKDIMEIALKHILNDFYNNTLSEDILRECFYAYSQKIDSKLRISYGLTDSHLDSAESINLLKNMYTELNFDENIDIEKVQHYLRSFATLYLSQNVALEQIQNILSDVDHAEQENLIKLIQAITKKKS